MSEFTVEPGNLIAGAHTVDAASAATAPLGDGIPAISPSAYGQIISGCVGVAEPFATRGLTAVLDQLAEVVATISTRLHESAAGYTATETSNAETAHQILVTIDATFN